MTARFGTTSLALALAAALGACGGDDADQGATTTTTADTTSDVDTTGDPSCVPIRPEDLGPLVLDGQDDVSTSYSFAVTGVDFGARPAPDFLVMQFINYNERIGPLAIGTFPLATAPNDNFGTCPECIAVWVDQPDISGPPSKILFQRAGTIRLDLDPRTLRLKGRIEGLELAEIAIDDFTLSSTFVEGGTCARLTAPLDLDFRWVPEAWTCDDANYNAEDGCDCGCGTDDPDCYDDDYEPVDTWRGCAATEVCHLGECREPCSAFAPTDACTTGTCVIEYEVDLCTSNTSLLDPAQVGQTCTKVGSQACGIVDGIQTGACNIDETPRMCRPLCHSRQDCDGDAFCWFLYGSPTFGEGKGFCLPGISPLWLCEADRWRDGATCDCGCGDIDPDCDVAGRPVRGCQANEVCGAEAACVPAP